MGKPIHIIWRENYRAKRYLDGKPVSHIAARMRYQVEGLLTLTGNGLIGPEHPAEGLGGWMWERFTHTLHEFELRGIPPPDNFLAGAAVPRTSHPSPPPELTAYKKRSRSEPGQIFKFGKRKWMEKMVDGEMRFAGGSYYQDPSLNAAIRDDEINFTIYPAGGTVDLARLGIRGFPSRLVPGGIVLSHPTDYYVQCLSNRYAMRMFKDFEADACVIVYDAKEFGRRVLDALRTAFPDWIVGAIPVTYIDPDDPGDTPLPIPAVKPMRYAYQSEERIICHPRTERFVSLHPAFVTFQPLHDIAELITLPPTT